MTSTRFRSFLIALVACFAVASDAYGEDLFRRVAEMVNDERHKLGLKRLAYNDKLEQAALSQARWMAEVGRMEHLRGERPANLQDFKASEWHHVHRVIKTGYLKWEDLYDLEVNGASAQLHAKPFADDYASEIISKGDPNTGHPTTQLPIVVPGWMRSPGHRAAIVKTSWEEIGGAYAMSRDGSTFWCVVFGKPMRPDDPNARPKKAVTD